jgi:nitrate reductase beta subunit
MHVGTGPNWDDNLAGAPEHAVADPLLRGIEDRVRMEYEHAFMFYLPRICEHCLNPSCVASCPSGAMYKREEDGVVLVDQDKCRAWRFCVSGCPYKKVYFNHRSGKAEKCTFCYPRIEVGLPTVCSETCVGRLRYLGLVLYDADRVEEAASVPDPRHLLESQLSVFLDPHDPAVQAAASAEGIADDWLEAARRSPVYRLAVDWRIALPLHPEYRTLPMVWYVPPLSPMDAAAAEGGYDGDPDDVFPAIERMRIPVEYLANLLAAGDADVIRRVLRRLAAMRGVMRALQVDGNRDEELARSVGMDVDEVEAMYRLLAIAKYDDRYVIPKAHAEHAARLEAQNAGCSVPGGPGGGYGEVGYPTSRRPKRRLNVLGGGG